MTVRSSSSGSWSTNVIASSASRSRFAGRPEALACAGQPPGRLVTADAPEQDLLLATVHEPGVDRRGFTATRVRETSADEGIDLRRLSGTHAPADGHAQGLP